MDLKKKTILSFSALLVILITGFLLITPAKSQEESYSISFEDKAKIQRDQQRWQDIAFLIDLLENYKYRTGHYPSLESGSFIPGMTSSKWPSWQEVLGRELGQTLPVDPLNKFAEIDENGDDCSECSDNNHCQDTCFNVVNENEKIYEVPFGSHIYHYQSTDEGQGYRLYANLEYSLPDNWFFNCNYDQPEECLEHKWCKWIEEGANGHSGHEIIEGFSEEGEWYVMQVAGTNGSQGQGFVSPPDVIPEQTSCQPRDLNFSGNACSCSDPYECACVSFNLVYDNSREGLNLCPEDQCFWQGEGCYNNGYCLTLEELEEKYICHQGEWQLACGDGVKNCGEVCDGEDGLTDEHAYCFNDCSGWNCKPGYRLYGSACEVNSCQGPSIGDECDIDNGQGIYKRYCNYDAHPPQWNDWVCQAISCNIGYRLYNNECEPDHCPGSSQVEVPLNHGTGIYYRLCDLNIHPPDWVDPIEYDTINCDEGYANCDGHMQTANNNGCEVNLTNDLDNCGQCGNACEQGECCINGQCQETDLNNDPNNCGECGRQCSGNESQCYEGNCVVCQPGKTEKGSAYSSKFFHAQAHQERECIYDDTNGYHWGDWVYIFDDEVYDPDPNDNIEYQDLNNNPYDGYEESQWGNVCNCPIEEGSTETGSCFQPHMLIEECQEWDTWKHKCWNLPYSSDYDNPISRTNCYSSGDKKCGYYYDHYSFDSCVSWSFFHDPYHSDNSDRYYPVNYYDPPFDSSGTHTLDGRYSCDLLQRDSEDGYFLDCDKNACNGCEAKSQDSMGGWTYDIHNCGICGCSCVFGDHKEENVICGDLYSEYNDIPDVPKGWEQYCYDSESDELYRCQPNGTVTVCEDEDEGQEYVTNLLEDVHNCGQCGCSCVYGEHQLGDNDLIFCEATPENVINGTPAQCWHNMYFDGQGEGGHYYQCQFPTEGPGGEKLPEEVPANEPEEEIIVPEETTKEEESPISGSEEEIIVPEEASKEEESAI